MVIDVGGVVGVEERSFGEVGIHRRRRGWRRRKWTKAREPRTDSGPKLLLQLAGDVTGRREGLMNTFDEERDGFTQLLELLAEDHQALGTDGDGEEDDDEDGDGEGQADPEQPRRREANPETAVSDNFSKRNFAIGEAFGGDHLFDILIIDRKS